MTYLYKSSIKIKSLNTKPCQPGLFPRIICQASPFLPKISQNRCTHQLWTVPPSPETLWLILGMGEKSYLTAKILLISPIRKVPLNRFKFFSVKKFHFFPIKQQFSSNHPMQSSFAAAVISLVSYFKFQALCTHMPY